MIKGVYFSEQKYEMDLFFPVTALSTPVWNLLSHSISVADQLSLLLLLPVAQSYPTLWSLSESGFLHLPISLSFSSAFPHWLWAWPPPPPQGKLKLRSERVLEYFYFLHLNPNHYHENKLRPNCWNTELGWITPLVRPS